MKEGERCNIGVRGESMLGRKYESFYQILKDEGVRLLWLNSSKKRKRKELDSKNHPHLGH